MIEILQKRKLTGDIVDLGSGPGNVIDYLISLEVMNTLIAVDFSEKFIHFLEQKYQNVENVRIIYDDIFSFLEQQEPSISAYIANYSIIHIPDDEVNQIFLNIFKSLQKGGVFIFSVWKGEKKEMEQEPYQVEEDGRLQVSEKLESYLNNFTEEELRVRLEQVGFKNIKIETFEPTLLPGEYPLAKIWVVAEKS